MSEIFDEDDQVYMTWLRRHPQGFVLNTRRKPGRDYLVLHRAGCYSISRYTGGAPPGGFTERSYIKVCADAPDDLRSWIKKQHGPGADFSKRCSICSP